MRDDPATVIESATKHIAALKAKRDEYLALAKSTTDEIARERVRVLRWGRRRDGLCVECGAPARCSRCDECRTIHSVRASSASKSAAPLPVSGPPRDCGCQRVGPHRIGCESRHNESTKAEKIEWLQGAAARGLGICAAAREVGISLTYAMMLRSDFGIVFQRSTKAPNPPEHYKRIGEASVASPRHHRFTNEDWKKAGATRSARAKDGS